MKMNRVWSGIAYVIILLTTYCLKYFIPQINGVPYGDFCFDLLIYFFGIVGTFEMLRAFKDKTTNAEKVIVFLFAMIAVPAVASCEAFGSKQYLGLIAVGALALAFAIVLLSLLVFDHEQTTLESLGLSLLAAVYPTLLLSLLVLCNHGFNTVDSELVTKFGLDSRLMILMVFVISPISDTIAFAFGCTLLYCCCARVW